MKIRFNLLIIIALLLGWGWSALPVQAATSVVHAVLFYSPSCGHCHQVITEDLPPLLEKYGDQLQIIGIDVTNEAGQALYQNAIKFFEIPDDRLGVPTLVIGETILVGSAEIPEQLPGLIESGLAAGGIALPAIPGLQEALANSQEAAQQEPAQAETPQASEQQPATISDEDEPAPTVLETMAERFNRDRAGNSLAVVSLIIMVASVIGVAYDFMRSGAGLTARWPAWLIPVLAVAGLGIALYLSFIEVTKTEAICGPVGDCNSVQQSPYATLFGFLPVGILGAAGFIAIGVAWIVQYYGPLALRKPATVAIWGMAWFGILFFIYLTFLEPFVIGATCAWCITTTVIMTLIFWASTGPAKAVWQIEDEDEFEEDDSDLVLDKPLS